MQTETLFPDLPVPITTGVVYLMTDGYKLKFGYTGRGTPKPRSGELRARVLGFMPGTRADEKALLALVAHWSVGGEWFTVPDDPDVLLALTRTAELMGQWQGIRATDGLLRVIAANLRRAA